MEAKEFIELGKERDILNENEDYDGAFEVECTQRDLGGELAEFIIEQFNSGLLS